MVIFDLVVFVVVCISIWFLGFVDFGKQIRDYRLGVIGYGLQVMGMFIGGSVKFFFSFSLSFGGKEVLGRFVLYFRFSIQEYLGREWDGGGRVDGWKVGSIQIFGWEQRG